MASGPEIRQYIKDACTKLDLSRYVSLNSQLISATWNDRTGKWDLEGVYLHLTRSGIRCNGG
jgi:cation diffusion facilitator CzcD-associated flavoprotein CzcO